MTCFMGFSRGHHVVWGIAISNDPTTREGWERGKKQEKVHHTLHDDGYDDEG
jgi:hypothetical protein